MNILSTIALLQLCFSATVTVSGDGPVETAVTAAPGDVAVLPCYSLGNVTPSLMTWMKNGAEVVRGGGPAGPPAAAAAAGRRLAVQHDGSLVIAGVIPGDEGSYLCHAALPGGTFQARVLLGVESQPEDVSLSVSASTTLLNGTSVAYRGSSVSFRCSASYPSQRLSLAFAGASSSNSSLVSTSGPVLDFRIDDVQPGSQGVYSCSASKATSNQTASQSAELLVYYVPDKHPECMWLPSLDSSHVRLNCSWFGAYPTPELRWRDDGRRATDSLLETLNSSLLSDGQTATCAARHPLLGPGTEKTCSLTFKFPYPEGEPLAAALEATNVTLACSETSSVPAANTTWRRGQRQDAIVPGPKYVLSEEGPVLKLTILNVSKDDEGVYFCRSENPLTVRELEVYLTVKTSSAYTGAIIGVFIAALIVGLAVIVAKTLYAIRHRICLGGGFGQIEEDGGEVLSLVESDDEQLFQDAVPQLPPVTNGHHTTLVQIHRIPSSDHEDAETADASSQQPEDTEETEEPEDLVTF